MTADIQRRFIAAVIADATGDRWRACRNLSPEAFEDWTHGKAWNAIREADTWESAARASGTAYLSDPTCGAYYEKDRDTLWIHWLSLRGLPFASEWAQTLPRTANSWPLPVSASSLCATPPTTPDVLVDGVLYRGGTMLVSGPSKSHKTYTMLAAGIAIAEGRPWLGFKTTAAPVLYLNLELQDFAVAKRVEHICHAMGTKPPANFHPWNLRGRRVTLHELHDRLPAEIKRLGAGFVVIDPHYKVSAVSGMEENSNDSQGMLLAALEGICNTNGAALGVCHHFAKGDASGKNAIDRASGGGVFARWGDVMMTFTPHEEDDAMTVEMALRNFAPVSPFVVRWDHPVWNRDGELDPAKLKKHGRGETYTTAKALDALTEPLSWSQWMKAAKMAESTFRRKVKALEAEGKVEQLGTLYRRKAA